MSDFSIGLRNLSDFLEAWRKEIELESIENEKKRIEDGRKAKVEYVVCNSCGQKFEPFYFPGRNEFGIINDKVDDCPRCHIMVSFANPKNKKSKDQKIKKFEYLHPEEIRRFGIILYSERKSDLLCLLDEK